MSGSSEIFLETGIFPLEIWAHIYRFADSKTLARNECLSKAIKDLINSHCLNSRWAHLTKVDYANPLKELTRLKKFTSTTEWKKLYCTLAKEDSKIKQAVKKILNSDPKTGTPANLDYEYLISTIIKNVFQVDSQCQLKIFNSLKSLEEKYSSQSDELKKIHMHLGQCYQHGIGVGKDPTQAIFHYKEAAELNNEVAQYKLGCAHINGNGAEENRTIAFDYMKRAADNHHPLAMCYVGECFLKGAEGICEANPVKAFGLFEEAASKDKTGKGAFLLGKCYQTGSGTEKNLDLALQYFQAAAKAGCKDALYELGLCYKTGYGIKKDLTQSFKAFSQAANANHPDALFEMSQIFKKGSYGQAADLAKACAYCKRAADLGLPSARFKLLSTYFLNNYVKEENLGDSVAYCEAQAALQNTPEAEFALGCYFLKKGNFMSCQRYFEQASEKNHSGAQFMLGNNYSLVLNDPIKAFEYYKLAADQGLVQAQIQVSKCYEDGIGVEKNPDEAQRYQLLATLSERDETEPESKRQKS